MQEELTSYNAQLQAKQPIYPARIYTQVPSALSEQMNSVNPVNNVNNVNNANNVNTMMGMNGYHGGMNEMVSSTQYDPLPDQSKKDGIFVCSYKDCYKHYKTKQVCLYLYLHSFNQSINYHLLEK